MPAKMPLGDAGEKRGRPVTSCLASLGKADILWETLMEVRRPSGCRCPIRSRNPPAPSRRDGLARSQPQPPQRPPLLATTTNEPFQPGRLYFAVPDASAVKAKLKRIACVQEVPATDCREWLFVKEAAGLCFPGTCGDVPKPMRPIVLGRIRFPGATAMTLQTNSFSRALEGARFFGARLGKLAVALRVRVINLCFAASEGDLQTLASMLDRDVVVVDPREAKLVIEWMARKAPSRAEALQRFIQGDFLGEDVPMVEDLPLYPEEETPDFQELGTVLALRAARAMEHWNGHTEVTIGSLLRLAVAQGNRGK